MKELGDLAYLGDITSKALVDYTKWVMLSDEGVDDLIGLFFTHDAKVIRLHHSHDLMQMIDQVEASFNPFLDKFKELKNKLVAELELTDREKSLWFHIWEFKKEESHEFFWEDYVESVKEYHSELLEITIEDQKFIDFWVKEYESK